MSLDFSGYFNFTILFKEIANLNFFLKQTKFSEFSKFQRFTEQLQH
jgi:hypothetical protein